LGNRHTVHGLLAGLEYSHLLKKTNIDDPRVEKFRILLDLPNMKVKNSEGGSGGLAINVLEARNKCG
jgi:hypothetical protein